MTAADLRVKPFCPCDLNRPQDCKPEDWGEAHAERICLTCSRPSYTHLKRPDGVLLCSDAPVDLDQVER